MRRATAGEVLKKAITVVVIVVLSLVAACAPAAPAPTPTPEPTPTPAWVPATKVEHMVGTWMGHFRWYEGVRYERFEADGTICYWYEGGQRPEVRGALEDSGLRTGCTTRRITTAPPLARTGSTSR